MCRTLLFLSIFLTVSYTNAQESISLNDCIDIAFKNNLRLKQSDLNIKRQQLIKKQTAWNSMPKIDAGITQDYEFGFNVNPTTNSRINEDFSSNDLYVRASLDVLDISKFKKHNKAKIDLKQTKANFENEKQQIKILVAQYYFDLLFKKEYLTILKKQVEESGSQLTRLNEALNYGYISKSELYDAEAEFSTDKKSVLLAYNAIKQSKLSLMNLINYDIKTEENIVFNDLFETDTTRTINETSYFKIIEEKNPALKSASLNVESAKKNVEINRANGLPKLALRYQLESFYTKSISNPDEDFLSFDNQIKNNQTQFAGASLRLPLFNGLQNKYNIKIAKIELEATKIEEDILKDNLRFEILQTLQGIENAIFAYRTSIQVLSAAEESFRTSRLKYEQGKINAFNFAIAKRNLFQSQFDLIDAKYALYFNKMKISILSE